MSDLEVRAFDGIGSAEQQVLDLTVTPASRLDPLQVEITRSKRRKKTAEARLRGNVVEIRIPAATSKAEEQDFVDHFVAKFEKHRRSALIDLNARAQHLAVQYNLPFPDSIRWVSNQQQRWGSCTPADGSIRLSDRMGGFPKWVIDYVIVHELAHLVEIDHNKAFWALVEPYPLAERARGYLIAKAEEGTS